MTKITEGEQAQGRPAHARPLMRDEDKSQAELIAELNALRAAVREHRAERSADEAELQLRTLLEHSPDVITLLDCEGHLVYLNRAADHVVGTHAAQHMPPEDRARFEAAFAHVLQTGETRHLALLSRDGMAWEARLVALRKGAEVLGVMGIGSDVTSQRRAEQALRESEEKLRLAIAATGIGLWRWDLARGEMTWDEGACRAFGVTVDERPRAIAECLERVHPDDRGRLLEAMTRASQDGVFPDLELRTCAPPGAERTLLCKGTGLQGQDGELAGVLGGVFDITERKRLEEQLRHSQKMEALGQLTAGIAHNFNNMLTVILSNVHLCEMRADEALKPRLQDASHAARRAADMVRELMVFARRHPPSTRRAIDVRDIVSRTAEICRTTFDRNIELLTRIDAEVPLVLGDPGQLEQVVLNICLNARDALEEAGTPRPRIALRVSAAPEDESPGGAMVCLSIEDNGPGMSEEVRRRIFEPFFTTKEVGRGTGLGLATAYGIVAEHGGEIDCRTQPGAGARFEVRLPATRRRAPTARAAALPSTPLAGPERDDDALSS